MSFEHSYKVEIVPIKQIPVELKWYKSPYRPKGKRFAIDVLNDFDSNNLCNDGTVDLST